jgi:ACS family hexuronate transporter-like MFS transporter
MTAAVGMWSFAAAAHAWASGFWSFGIARAALGSGEGATFPGGLRTVAQTLPPEKRGRGLAISYSGGSLGAMITPFIVTPIALRFGWRGAFLVTGSFGFAWLILWRFVARGIDERTEIREQNLPWLHPSLWAYIAAYALGAMPLGFILYDSSIYLHARFAWDQATLGKVLWIPPLGWEIGYFVWGWIVDRSGRQFGALMPVCLVLSIPLAWMHSLPSGAWVLGEMFLAMFALAGFVVVAVAYATDAFAGNAGLIAGIGAGSWGAVIAITSPYFGKLFDQGEYAAAFRIATLFPVVGYALWAWFSRARTRHEGLVF